MSPPLPLHGSACAELTAAVVLLRSFFMNEYKIEGMTKWIKLLRQKGWDPVPRSWTLSLSAVEGLMPYPYSSASFRRMSCEVSGS